MTQSQNNILRDLYHTCYYTIATVALHVLDVSAHYTEPLAVHLKSSHVDM